MRQQQWQRILILIRERDVRRGGGRSGRPTDTHSTRLPSRPPASAGAGPFTVFAASNDGVTASGATLSADAVKASVIDGTNFTRADLAKGTKSDSMLDKNTIVTYTGTDGSLYVNDIKVIGDPITAGNGTVYVIDGAIQPK